MGKITKPQIVAAFALAVDVYENKLSAALAAKKLQDDHNLNHSSAMDFIEQYRQMRHGNVFKRTMSSSAMEYFLPRILELHGPSAAEMAVQAVWKHIEYYEPLAKTTMHTLRLVVNKFQVSNQGAIDASNLQAQFENRVRKSLQDTAAARSERLKVAEKTPTMVIASVKIFVRNPDVVAAVLNRANGICERCKLPAPFKRKSDHSAYLEVHHKVLLAEGGLDVVENAIALCPNCHRELHYGN